MQRPFDIPRGAKIIDEESGTFDLPRIIEDFDDVDWSDFDYDDYFDEYGDEEADSYGET